MEALIHLCILRYFLRPFHLSRNKAILFLGDVLRRIFVFIFKCDISPLAEVPFSTRFPHYIGIVIGACRMGEHCVIRNNVTIGKKTLGVRYPTSKGMTIAEHQAQFPVLGDEVIVGSNACIIGPVQVGSSSVIGAGSVVVSDIESNAVYAGVPAKKIKSLREAF